MKISKKKKMEKSNVMKKNHTIRSLQNIVEFGYDNDNQMYIELCNNCTMVMKYDIEDNVNVQLYRNGTSVNRRELSKNDLHLIDNILEEYKGIC